MALTSPGVEVSVIDESFYTPAEPGTTPMIFVASAENKSNASGTGTAQGTLAANAGKPYLLTSQRDLADTFGDPVFYTDNNNNPIHGGELNEYGLQAAYSYLGVSNAAWVVRADIDLGQLEASAETPSSNPADGTYWLDTSTTTWGIQEWNGSARTVSGGQTFTTKTPIVITDSTLVTGGAPKSSVGAIGDYAVVATSTNVTMWYRSAGNGSSVTAGDWVMLGSDDWTASWATVRSTVANPTLGNGNFVLNGTTITVTGSDTISDVASTINGLSIAGISAQAVDGRLEIYSDSTSSGADDSTAGGAVVIAAGTGDTMTEIGLTAGTYYPPILQVSKHTSVPEWKTNDTYTRPSGAVWIKTTEPNGGARWRVKSWNDATQLWDAVDAPLYATHEDALYGIDLAGGGANIPVGDVYVQTNTSGDTLPLAQFKIYKRVSAAPTTVTGGTIDPASFSASPGTSYTVGIKASAVGSASLSETVNASFTLHSGMTAAACAEAVASAITNADVANVSAEVTTTNKVVITHSKGGEIRLIDDASNAVLSKIGFTRFTSVTSGTPNLYYAQGTDGDTVPLQLQAGLWKATVDSSGSEVSFYTAQDTEVTALADDNTLWYSSVVDEVDIMINNGGSWVGYNNFDHTGGGFVGANSTNDPAGPQVTATEPTSQSDGSGLVNGDIWIDTSDLENYPAIYVYDGDNLEWVLRDNSDQTTENGVLFADARWNTSGGSKTSTTMDAGDIDALLISNFLDSDAPDPALYPKGMLLFNLRRSGFNVKRFVRNYVDQSADNGRYNDEAMTNYYPHRWVTESGNQEDGSGSFGRKAQRKVVVQALQAVVNSNDEIRDDESRVFNLMATPGYPELIGEMISLNYDRGLTAFVVGDSPARLTPDATSLNNWATNVALAAEDNDNGLVTRDEYFGVFYPWGYTSDNAGNNVVVPPSHMMLRTIALSDQVSYPWFAPAGTRRGGITNATATGYISDEGEFVTVALNEGQRDTLYAQNVNPITFISGAGLVNYGQKTRAKGSSALDRINVARLVIYLRSQLNKLAKPYIFEPNDKITRDQIKQAAESLCLELVGQRALYDFLVVCDESNNTPSRIDRNELYLDIAIEPVKAVEFIYIPLRLKNTGEIAGL